MVKKIIARIGGQETRLEFECERFLALRIGGDY